MPRETHSALEFEHRPEMIRRRLSAHRPKYYLGDAVLGTIDGCVTTFAVVAGAYGGELRPGIALLLGVANLVADGFSMAVGNFQRVKSDLAIVERARRTEERHITLVPEGEREEIREAFRKKGFAEPLLSEVVKVITADRKLWVDTMLTEELGLRLDGQHPWRAACATFAGFFVAGFIPLIPYVFSDLARDAHRFAISVIVTGVTFFTIGYLKGRTVEQSPWRSAWETLAVGGLAAALAYGVGTFLRGIAG